MELDPDTGKPMRYFEHPRRVALILIDEVGCVDPVLLMAALVHDGVEDTRLITPDRIERHLGPDVARIVTMLSKVPKEGYLERLEKFADWRALLIKACDRLDNLRSLGGAAPEFVRKQVDETKTHYLGLFDRMVEQTPPELRKGARRVRKEIDSLLRRHEALLKRGGSGSAAKKPRRVRRAATR
jgi:(p)ppGpp synthase/HD superfamily hydrolase